MFYMDVQSPDVMSVSSVVVAAPYDAVAADLQRSYGVCQVVYADKIGKGFIVNKSYLDDLLPDSIKELQKNKGLTASDQELEKYIEWGQSLNIRIISEPTNGRVDINSGVVKYFPNDEYKGKDYFEVLVSGLDYNGRSFSAKAIYYINVISKNRYFEMDWSIQSKKICGSSKDYWRISSGSVSADALTGLSLVMDASFAGVIFTFAELSGQSLGLTSGTSITLDANAAGHGWYFDWQSSGDDWLPTSNPNEWIARAGSAADGKMDFTSVLLHEYGHALGLEHSVDSHDLMATTLQPGVRRLPSAEELAEKRGRSELILEGKGVGVI